MNLAIKVESSNSGSLKISSQPSLKTISSYLRHFKKNKTIIFITHNSRILDYIQPDKVLILKNGLIIKDGDADLLSFIEKKGFDKL